MIPMKPPPNLANPKLWSKEMVDFLSKCLIKNAEERPTAAQLLSHPWIADTVREIGNNKGLEVLRKLVDRNWYKIQESRARASGQKSNTHKDKENTPKVHNMPAQRASPGTNIHENRKNKHNKLAKPSAGGLDLPPSRFGEGNQTKDATMGSTGDEETPDNTMKRVSSSIDYGVGDMRNAFDDGTMKRRVGGYHNNTEDDDATPDGTMKRVGVADDDATPDGTMKRVDVGYNDDDATPDGTMKRRDIIYNNDDDDATPDGTMKRRDVIYNNDDDDGATPDGTMKRVSNDLDGTLKRGWKGSTAATDNSVDFDGTLKRGDLVKLESMSTQRHDFEKR